MSSTLNRLQASTSPLVYPKENPSMKTLVDSLRRQNRMLQNEIEEMAQAIDKMAHVINTQNEKLKTFGAEEVDHREPEGMMIDLSEKPDKENPDDS